MPPRPAADEVDAGGDVAPLVGPGHLELAALGLVQDAEVVGLQEHVGELGEGDAVVPLDPGPDRVLGQHRVDGDVLADVAEELEDAHRLGPGAVVDQPGLRGPGLEVEEPLELGRDRGEVGGELLELEEGPLRRTAARGRRSCRSRRRPARSGGARPVLEPPQQEDLLQVADVQRVGGGVEPAVERRPAPRPSRAAERGAVGRVVDQVTRARSSSNGSDQAASGADTRHTVAARHGGRCDRFARGCHRFADEHR